MTARRFPGTKVVLAVLLLAALGGLAAGVSAVSAAEPAQGDAKAAPLLRHVVLFGFKPEATPEDVKKVEDAFAALADSNSGTLRFSIDPADGLGCDYHTNTVTNQKLGLLLASTLQERLGL